MVLATEVWAPHHLIRPFFGTGVLGGYTTFSTCTSDIQHLVEVHRAPTGAAYLGLTLIAALAAVWSAVWLMRRVVVWRKTWRD